MLRSEKLVVRALSAHVLEMLCFVMLFEVQRRSGGAMKGLILQRSGSDPAAILQRSGSDPARPGGRRGAVLLILLRKIRHLLSASAYL